LPLLPDVLILVLLLISPSKISLPLSGVINDFNFLAPIPVRVDPSNSLVNGSAIGSLLPVLQISITAFRTVPQRGQLQTLVPTMLEEGTSPVRALLLARVLFLVPSVCFFFGIALLLLVASLLVALLLHLALPLVEEDARGHPGLGSGRLPDFDVTLENAGGFTMHLFQSYLALWVHCSILSSPG
jgi:hypothetical protein